MAKDAGACRLVYVGEDGDVYQASAETNPTRLTCGWSNPDECGRLHYVWPSYSPDGSLVACFGVRQGRPPEAGLYAVDEDGVAMREIWRTAGAAPICESWSPDSRRIALLLQSKEGLKLELASIDHPGKTVTVETGSPLFWSWSPTAGFLAVHTGGSQSVYEDARLVIFRIGERCTEVASLSPGEFRTPAWSPDGKRLAYIEANEDKIECLAFYRLEDGVSEIVCPVEGHAVMMWSPDGKYLALSQALGETPHVFTGLTLVDARTGRAEVVSEHAAVSFFWSPCSSRLVSLAFAESEGMQWSVFDVLGMRRRLGSRFYPSKELVYFCWFFDQFAPSHPVISADGSRLVFAGHVVAGKTHSIEGESGVYVVSLVDERPLQRIASGHFACWDAQLREGLVR